MNAIYVYVSGFSGLIVGGAIAYFYVQYKRSLIKTVPFEEFDELKKKFDSLAGEKVKFEERANLLSSENESLKAKVGTQNDEIKRLSSEISAKNAEFSALNQKLIEHKAEFETMREKLKTEFENVANKIFETKNKTFNAQSRENIESILIPLKDKLKSFEDRVNQIHTEDAGDRGALLEKIKQLQDLNNRVTEEAKNLTKALKGESKIQGNWGELVLEKMLQSMGLEKDTHYFWQKKFKDEKDSKKSKQPDIIINLPDDRHIIVDSKVSLKDYTDYFNTQDEGKKIVSLKKHLESVERHIDELSEKDYHEIHSISVPDFVIMFMPIESALHIALQEARERGKDLFKEAFEKKIILASTSNLFPIFKTISYIWNQDKQSRNAVDIARRGGELYDKFVNFLMDMKKIGDGLKTAENSYEAAFNKLSKGRGNLVRQVEMIKELGAKASKELPPDMAAKALDSD